MLETYVKKILSSKVYDLAKETPLSPARLLTQRFGTQVYLKREDLQSIFSFKLKELIIGWFILMESARKGCCNCFGR